MRNPQVHQIAMIQRLAIRARTTGTVGDSATLAAYVAKVFEVNYARAAEVCRVKYGVQVVERAYAGRVAMHTAKNPGKDMLAVRFDKSTISEKRIPESVPAIILSAIA
jgi:hypothetical protein